jgi:hypothetical protein
MDNMASPRPVSASPQINSDLLNKRLMTPAEPLIPEKRKRMKFEYTPLLRKVETYAGWHLERIEGAFKMHDSQKRSRDLRDLGTFQCPILE